MGRTEFGEQRSYFRLRWIEICKFLILFEVCFQILNLANCAIKISFQGMNTVHHLQSNLQIDIQGIPA